MIVLIYKQGPPGDPGRSGRDGETVSTSWNWYGIIKHLPTHFEGGFPLSRNYYVCADLT